MPEPQREIYAAACNPPRRAKRTNIPLVDPVATSLSPPTTASPDPSSSTSSPHQHRPILPMKPYAPRESTQANVAAAASGAPEQPAPPPPAKRGRKPGPLSRTAREAQRRLNHSIIEKARRTKINDALATLKQLVPPNYVSGQLKQQQQQHHHSSGDPSASRDEEEEEEEDDDDDDEYDDESSRKKKHLQQKAKAKQTGKGTGKKEEKEKEFKLEILVRTVSFLQDILEKVNSLEATSSATTLPAPPVPIALPPTPQLSCPNCGSQSGKPATDPEPSNWRKRKHMDDVDGSDDQLDDHSNPGCDPEKPNASERQAKIPRRYSYGHRGDAGEERSFERMHVDDNNPSSVSRNRTFVERPHRAAQTEGPRPQSHTSSSPTERLPPISSWLHNHNSPRNERVPPSPSTTPPSTTISNSVIDPQLLPAASSSELVKPSRSRTHSHSSAYIHASSQPSPSYLPTPPGSTHFDPVRSSAAGVPPLLNLGPGSSMGISGESRPRSKGGLSPENHPSVLATRGRSSSYTANGNSSSNATSSRTPEDESAASLLLQIASSPSFRPVPESGSTTSSPVFRAISSGSASSGMKNGYPDHQRDPSVLMLSSSDVRSEVVIGGSRREGVAGGYHGSSRVQQTDAQQQQQRDRAHLQHEHHQQQAQTPSSLLGLNLGFANGRRY